MNIIKSGLLLRTFCLILIILILYGFTLLVSAGGILRYSDLLPFTLILVFIIFIVKLLESILIAKIIFYPAQGKVVLYRTFGKVELYAKDIKSWTIKKQWVNSNYPAINIPLNPRAYYFYAKSANKEYIYPLSYMNTSPEKIASLFKKTFSKEPTNTKTLSGTNRFKFLLPFLLL